LPTLPEKTGKSGHVMGVKFPCLSPVVRLATSAIFSPGWTSTNMLSAYNFGNFHHFCYVLIC